MYCSMEAYSKVSDFISSIKDVVLFPITKVSKGDEHTPRSEHGKSSDSPWVNLIARSQLKSKKQAALKYTIIGLLVAATISASAVLIKRHMENVKYERKRLEDLEKKLRLNTATEDEIKEAVELSDNILKICAMENPTGVESTINNLQSEIIKEVA